jgi:tetratricopeptide (TPR) repeat protein
MSSMPRIALLLISAATLVAGCAADPRFCQPSESLTLGRLGVDERSSCDQAIALAGADPAHLAYAYRQRALTWTLPSEVAPALRDADSAIRLQPDDPDGYHVRAAIDRATGDRDRAIADLGAAIERSHGGARLPQFYEDQLYWQRAELYAAAGLHAQAVADYGEVLRGLARPFDRTHELALDHRAELNLRLGRLDDALRDYDAMLREQPDDAWVHWVRGSIKAHRHDAAGADADIAAARRLDPHVEPGGWAAGVYPTGPLSPTTSRLWLRPTP